MINGYCPQGCGETLDVNAAGNVMCVNATCPEPYTIADILQDPETEHIITCYSDSWSMKHPLRERLNDELLTCAAGEEVSETAYLMDIGTYRLSGGPDWVWEHI